MFLERLILLKTLLTTLTAVAKVNQQVDDTQCHQQDNLQKD